MLKSIEIVLLRHCREGWVPLKPLFEQHVRATVYRVAKKLLQKGLLGKSGSDYKTTPAGIQELAAQESHRQATSMSGIYSPLECIPGVAHRALIELVLAAISVRQYTESADHLPSFLVFGSTMRWKTSLAVFTCHALGIAPETHIVDLATESGRSVWLRKTASGDIAFKRSLLEASFVTFDEYLLTSPKVKVAVGHFLSGRRLVPLENEVLEIKPVSLLTLNPKEGKTLMARTTFHQPQLRRLIVMDANNVSLPDIALEGTNALEAARNHESLKVGAPRTDCTRYRKQVVRILRRALKRDAEGFVDYESVLQLCTGTTAFIENEDEAIRHALLNYCRVAETVGWAKECWLDVIGSSNVAEQPQDSEDAAEEIGLTKRETITLWPFGKE